MLFIILMAMFIAGHFRLFNGYFRWAMYSTSALCVLNEKGTGSIHSSHSTRLYKLSPPGEYGIPPATLKAAIMRVPALIGHDTEVVVYGPLGCKTLHP